MPVVGRLVSTPTSFQLRKLPIQMPQCGLQLLPASRMSGAFKIFENSCPRQFKTRAFTPHTNFFGAQRSLPRRGAFRRRFLHLRLDVLTFPTAGHFLFLFLKIHSKNVIFRHFTAHRRDRRLTLRRQPSRTPPSLDYVATIEGTYSTFQANSSLCPSQSVDPALNPCVTQGFD